MIEKEKDFFSKFSNSSKLKLEILNGYIEPFLYKVLGADYTTECLIGDLFCGQGLTKNGEEGSPIILLNIIEGVLNNDKIKEKGDKIVNVIFNDLDKDNINKLKAEISKKSYNKNIKIILLNQDVKGLIDKIKKLKVNGARFFFLDPFGYTKEKIGFSLNDINDLMTTNSTEVLLFNPIQFAYRGYRISLKKDKDYTNIEKFKKDYGLDSDDEIGNLYIFSMKIRENISKNIKYVIPILIDSRNALFLLTNNINGADLMIDEISKKSLRGGVNIKSKEKQLQLGGNLSLDFQPDYYSNYIDTFEKKILEKTKEYGKISNKYIIELRCKFGLHYKLCEDILKKLQKEGKIRIIGDIKKSLYSSIRYYNKKENEKYFITLS